MGKVEDKEKKEQRVIEIKARMFDLMVHRDSVNKQVSSEMKQLNQELLTLSEETTKPEES